MTRQQENKAFAEMLKEFLKVFSRISFREHLMLRTAFSYGVEELEQESNKLLDVINNQDVKIADLEQQIEKMKKADIAHNDWYNSFLEKHNEEICKRDIQIKELEMTVGTLRTFSNEQATCIERLKEENAELKAKYLQATDEGTSFAHLKSLERENAELKETLKNLKKFYEKEYFEIADRTADEKIEELEQYQEEVTVDDTRQDDPNSWGIMHEEMFVPKELARELLKESYALSEHHKDQLAQAKEIIEEILEYFRTKTISYPYSMLEVLCKAEQFLNGENIILEDTQAGNSPFDADEVFNKKMTAYPAEKVKKEIKK